MLDSKYNRFLWYYLTGLDNITNSEGRLVCKVPFGNYKVDEVPDDNFNSELTRFIENNNLEIITVKLVCFVGFTAFYEHVFKFDGAYYKVIIGKTCGDYDYVCSWINLDLENFQVFPKKKTITVYEY